MPGLIALQKKYSDLQLLFFPSNPFCSEEPGAASEIKAFYCSKHGLSESSSLMERADVNGRGAQDVYMFLRSGNLPDKAGEPIA